MAVYERSYRRYAGPLTEPRWRFMVLPRYAIREVLRTRLLFAYLMACQLVPLFCAAWIYVPHNSTIVKTFLSQIDGPLPAIFAWSSEQFFWRFMFPQSFFAFFLVFLIGPALISADMRNNALPLYFSRPFSRWEYLAGKSTVLTLMVSTITWIPGLALFLLKAYLEGGGWLGANLRTGVAILLSWWIWIAVMTLVSLAISAYVKWKAIAQLGLFVVFVVGAGFSAVLNLTLGTHWGSLFNIGEMLRVVWAGLFAVDMGVPQVPPAAAWIALLALCALCLLLLQRKVRAYEVVRS